jgi:hypothetical protein
MTSKTHALGIGGDRQHRQALPLARLPGPGRQHPGAGPVPVKPLRVRGRPGSDLLQLPLADGHPGGGQHQRARLLIGHRPAEHHRQPLQRPGIPARRQVQHRITREQRPHPPDPGPVGDPPHRHLPQPGHDGPGMTTLGTGPRHPVRAGHPRQPDLAPRLGTDGQLQHPAQQVPAPPGHQQVHRLQRHRPARLRRQPGQPRRQRPQPRHHRIRASSQLIQPVLFHQRLPFRDPDFTSQDHRNGSLTPAQTPRTRSLQKSRTHVTSLSPWAPQCDIAVPQARGRAHHGHHGHHPPRTPVLTP